jgi:hypothetical protein
MRKTDNNNVNLQEKGEFYINFEASSEATLHKTNKPEIKQGRKFQSVISTFFLFKLKRKGSSVKAHPQKVVMTCILM